LDNVVIDTNVLISATLFGGNPEKILDMAQEGRINLLISNEMLDEFKKVLHEKFDFSIIMAAQTASVIKEISTIITSGRKLSVIKQKESDNRILECAVAGSAQYIITGDTKHLLPLKKYRKIKILKPAQFLKLMEGDVIKFYRHMHMNQVDILNRKIGSPLFFLTDTKVKNRSDPFSHLRRSLESSAYA